LDQQPLEQGQGAIDKIEKLDYILISHGHFDHVGDAIALQKKTNAKIVAAFELVRSWSRRAFRRKPPIRYARQRRRHPQAERRGQRRLVQAVHSSGFQSERKRAHPLCRTAIGFVIQIKGGPTLYHTGDTAWFSEMKQIGARFHPDVCSPASAITSPWTAGRRAGGPRHGAKTAVPIHYGTFPVLTGTPSSSPRRSRPERPGRRCCSCRSARRTRSETRCDDYATCKSAAARSRTASTWALYPECIFFDLTCCRVRPIMCETIRADRALPLAALLANEQVKRRRAARRSQAFAGVEVGEKTRQGSVVAASRDPLQSGGALRGDRSVRMFLRYRPLSCS